MSTSELLRSEADTGTREGLPVIDCDMHPTTGPEDPAVAKFLPRRWIEYVENFGVRSSYPYGVQIPNLRGLPFCLDQHPPDGGLPGSDPAFATQQLLDRYDITAAIANHFGGLAFSTGGNVPVQLTQALTVAFNEWCRESWLEYDPRYLGAITVPHEDPAASVAEIERCMASHDRFVQLLMPSVGERPLGNPRYWPIYEAAVAHDLPVAFHVAHSQTSTQSGVGWWTYYFEGVTGHILHGMSLIPSLIFEGVFDRFPKMKVVVSELGWAWVPPLIWRMDAAYNVFRSELPHLQRLPSEYFAEHFWLTTQPIEEPEDSRWIDQFYQQIEDAGLGDRLLFATDYAHHDFDSPNEALPAWLPRETKRKILGENAASLYGVTLPEAS
jgi:uncharacterized protein